MLTNYIKAAMRHAMYKTLDNGTWFGEIPGLEGLWANGPTVEATRDEILSALEDWILFGLLNGFLVPAIDGIDLTKAKVPAA